MYHLVNNLTTRTGDALAGYYVKLKDAGGNYATLYADSNSTPIVSVSGIADTAITDENGVYDIYVDDGEYSIEVFDKNDVNQRLRTIPSASLFSGNFTQTGTGAVARTVQAKSREQVSLEDFYSDNFADALEAASAVGSTVHIYGASYTIDRVAAIAADTDIILHGTTISAAVGNTATHMLTFAGSGSISGTGVFDGAELDAPTGPWLGVGVPQGSCIYSAVGIEAARAGSLRIGSNITFRDFPSGAVFVKWLELLDVSGVTLDNCQTATVQYKASGSYTNVATTNTLANELITSSGIEAYHCDTVRLANNRIPAVSKGISISANSALTSGNTYTNGTTRHAMEHFVDCGQVSRIGNFYDGGADKGDAYKIFNCDSATGANNVLKDVSYGGYFQDSDNINIGPETMTGVVAAAYGFSTTSAGRALTNCSLQLGSLSGAAGSSVIYIFSEAGAVTAGYGLAIGLSGGRCSGFTRAISQTSSGLGYTLDLDWTGTTIIGTSEPMDLRVRSASVDCTYKSCSGTALVDIGCIKNAGSGVVVTGRDVSVKARAIACSATYHVRYGAAALYDAQFEKAAIDISSTSGTAIWALSFSMGASDTLKLLDLTLNCPDLDPGSTGGGQGITFNANSKTFKMRFKAEAVMGLGSYTPLNLTLSNAGSVTGVYEKPIAGTLTGGALTAV